MDYKKEITDSAVSDLDSVLQAWESLSEGSKALLVPVDSESIASELEAIVQREIVYLGEYAELVSAAGLTPTTAGALNNLISKVMNEIANGLRARATLLESSLQIVELSKWRPK